MSNQPSCLGTENTMQQPCRIAEIGETFTLAYSFALDRRSVPEIVFEVQSGR